VTPTTPASGPGPWTGCAHCARPRRCSRLILGEPVCADCVSKFAYRPAACPGCEQVKVLAFYDTAGRAACAACTGHRAVYACIQCGGEDSHYGLTCGRCTVARRATELLTGPDGTVCAQLRPVLDVLVSAPRPRTTLFWFTRSRGPAILAAMARGEIEITHAAFETMAPDKTVNYLRDLLVAVGVLPAFDPELERLTPWLADLLATSPHDHAEILSRFARWHVLRRLRHQQSAGRLTHGAINGARATIVASARFLAWLAEHQTTIHTARQDHCDQYALARPGQAKAVVAFLAWTTRTGLTSDITLPAQPKTQPHVTLADAERWGQVDQLLADDTIRLYVRIAGLFTLLFAQPLARIAAMRADQVTTHDDGRVAVTFDTVPVDLPPPLARLVLAHLARRGQASYASSADKWLFPGGIPGRHLVTENFRSQLVERGIQPCAARNAAMLHLSAAMPSAVLADVLGRSPGNAARWAALSAHDWNQYTAQRLPPHDE
jgi:hypothetical protein